MESHTRHSAEKPSEDPPAEEKGDKGPEAKQAEKSRTEDGEGKIHPANESKDSMNFGALVYQRKKEKQEAQEA